MNSGESVFCSCFCCAALHQEMMTYFGVNYQLFNTEVVCTLRDNLKQPKYQSFSIWNMFELFM